eukprot:13109630-Ditylum_brightwellii.AAC.1
MEVDEKCVVTAEHVVTVEHAVRVMMEKKREMGCGGCVIVVILVAEMARMIFYWFCVAVMLVNC